VARAEEPREFGNDALGAGSTLQGRRHDGDPQRASTSKLRRSISGFRHLSTFPDQGEVSAVGNGQLLIEIGGATNIQAEEILKVHPHATPQTETFWRSRNAYV
jgi:hypothetical protein